MKQVTVTLMALFVLVVSCGSFLRSGGERALLARSAADDDLGPRTEPSFSDATATLGGATQAGEPTWGDFTREWELVLQKTSPGAPRNDDSTPERVALAFERLLVELRRVQLIEIAAGARSRYFMSDTETLLAATHPDASAPLAEHARSAATELRSVLAWLHDPSRPRLGLAQAGTDLLVGTGPSRYPTLDGPTARDLQRLAEETKRFLIYSSVNGEEVVHVTDRIYVLLRRRIERAEAYDRQLSKAISLARTAVQGTGNSRARRALDARLYASLDAMIELLEIDIRDFLTSTPGRTGQAPSIDDAISDVEGRWSNERGHVAQWLSQPSTGDLRRDYAAFLAAGRGPGEGPPSLPAHLQSFLNGIQRDRKASGIDSPNGLAPTTDVYELMNRLQSHPPTSTLPRQKH
ncbi:MAG: hypothetical protein IT360_23090 [Gemmatimonadaceae bacterium]|nr:hypothetical protein [Gemmatimonadaceae bacterium]